MAAVNGHSDGKHTNGSKKETMEDKEYVEQHHRLHYRWSQLEADRCGINIGSPVRPLPSAHRTLELNPTIEYEENDVPLDSNEDPEELAKFSRCAGVYKNLEYNTFSKNSFLKLSEVEMYFLSSKMNRKTASEWAVVYLCDGDGLRFRWLRDSFFPGLSILDFHPLYSNTEEGKEEEVVKTIEETGEPGLDFTFRSQRFDLDTDCPLIKDKLQGKKLLLISDIRGMTFTMGDTTESSHSKGADHVLQWEAIKRLRPERSLVKFSCPDPWQQFYEYAPGVLLKQVFCYYNSRDLRLVIDGVPEKMQRYNVWDLYAKMMFHHEHLRGQVYKMARSCETSRCLDCSFDCSVLWDTVSAYARDSDMDAKQVLNMLIKYHIYDPFEETPAGATEPAAGATAQPARKNDFEEVGRYLSSGKLMEAIAALECDANDEDRDWADIVQKLDQAQPYLAERLKVYLHRPASRASLIQVLGSLSSPFTAIGTELNLLMVEEEENVPEAFGMPYSYPFSSYEEPPQKRQRTVWDEKFDELGEKQRAAAIALGWTKDTWEKNVFHLPRKTPWESLSEVMQKALSELGECAETWDSWKKGR